MSVQAEHTEITIGHRLRRVLRLRGHTIREFSEKTGIPYRTLQDYLSDKAKPGSDQLARISNADIDVDFILTGKARSFGRLINRDEPADAEKYYILADREIVEAIDARCRVAMNILTAQHARDKIELEFDFLLDCYTSLFYELSEIFSKSSPPIEEIRKLKVSVKPIVNAVLDTAVEFVLTKLVAQKRHPS